MTWQRSRYWGNKRIGRRTRATVLYAEVTAEELGALRPIIDREGLTVSDFVRRCINGYLLDEGDNMPLLEERERKRKRDPRAAGGREP